MNAPRSNVPETLKTAAAIEKRRYEFDPVVADSIALPVDLHGIVAIRQWKLAPGLFLDSYVQPRRYSSGFVWADDQPAPGNHSGIYAYQLLNYVMVTSGFSAGYVIGIVELAGRVIEHTDGTYRAECCRVLQFFTHTGLAARVSRIYGVPCVIADCGNEVGCKIVNWLTSHDGIRCLQWNLQFPADLEAERLLSGVESLGENMQQPVEGDVIPEELKDMGGWTSLYTNEATIDCTDGGIVIRNDAIKSKYPGGMEAFTFNHRCIYNEVVILVKDEFPGTLTATLADLADNGLNLGYDFAVFERWGRLKSMSIGQNAALNCWLHVENRCIVTFIN